MTNSTSPPPPHPPPPSSISTCTGSFNNASCNTRIPRFVKKAVMIASLGGILFGYDMGVISAALPQLANEFELSSTQKEMVVSFLFLGGALGAGVGGTLCDKIGRKKAILITDIMFIIGAAVLLLSYSVSQVLIGRIIVGFAVAVSGIADVAYLHEISPIEWRGAIVSVNEACISLGFLISYLVGALISRLDGESGWRYMFGAGSVIALFQFIGMIYMPESPVWLQSNNEVLQAQIAFAMINGNDASSNDSDDLSEYNSYQQPHLQINDEHQNINAYISEENNNLKQYRTTRKDNKKDTSKSTRTSNKSSPYINVESQDSTPYSYKQSSNHSSREVKVPLETDEQISQESHEQTTVISSEKGFFSKAYLEFYPQLVISAFISIMQQFCGHPNVLNYAPEIFNEVGVTSLLSTVLVGLLKFVITCLVIWKIEQLGRKFLLLLGMSIIAISLLLLWIAFAALDENGELTKIAQVSAIIGIFGVAGGYALSFGPLGWLLVSELFPSSIRGRALGAATITTYLSGLIVSYSFLSVQDYFGIWVPFAGYFLLTFFSILYVLVAVPETSGRDVTTIQEEIGLLWWWRRRNKRDQKFEVCETDNEII